MARPTLELHRKAAAPGVAEDAAADVAPIEAAVPPAVPQPKAAVRRTLLGEIETALAGATDARVHSALATLATLLHEMRIKFGAAEHLIADDLRAKIKSIL